MRTGLIAQKLGMTRVFKNDGTHVPVTLLSIEKNYIVGIKNNETTDYKQLQIATGNIKNKKVLKPLKNFYSNQNLKLIKILITILVMF